MQASIIRVGWPIQIASATGIISTVSDGNLLTPVKTSCGVLYSSLGEECRLPK
jgi:hypothetical protein